MKDKPKPRKQDAATPTTGEWTDESLARFFHDTYEMLAPSFGYETRPDTREFNPESKNGRLMVTVCGAVLLRFNAALAAEREKTEAYRDLWHGQQRTTSGHLKTILQLRSQLSAAQAFIEQCKNAMTGTGSWSLGDTEHTALDAAIAAAQEPLMDALIDARNKLNTVIFDSNSILADVNKILSVALAKVKEGK